MAGCIHGCIRVFMDATVTSEYAGGVSVYGGA